MTSAERPVLSHDLVDDLAPPEPPEEIAGGRLGGLAEPLEFVELPVVAEGHRQRLQGVGERLGLWRGKRLRSREEEEPVLAGGRPQRAGQDGAPHTLGDQRPNRRRVSEAGDGAGL